MQTIAIGYAGYILLIFLLLCLPFSAKDVSWLDNLFTAASAVSTTGLATVSTPGSYGFWGQLFILLGIQMGGLGYMSLGSFAIMASRHAVSPSRLMIGKSVFSLPDAFEPMSFIRRAVVFTLVFELIGALCLWVMFRMDGLENALWPAIFHSVSAFCTAGFSVFPDSLMNYRSHVGVNLVVSILSLAGAVGFIVISDIWLKFRVKGRLMTLTSKIILVATFGGIFLGTLALYFDPSVRQYAGMDRVLAAFFQAMTALTTVGFNTIDVSLFSFASVLIVLVLMILGASPSGTGGGLKSTSWSAGLAAVWSSIRGKDRITFFGNVIPSHRIQAAFASFTLYLACFAAGSYVLLLADRHRFEDVIFEVASALGTVGLSRGITGDLTDFGKVVVILLMFIGRVGVISLGLAALPAKKGGKEETIKESDLVI